MSNATLIQSKKDIGLLNRAIQEQWPTTPEVRTRALNELVKLTRSRDKQVKLAAIDQLRKIDKHNFDMAKAAIPTLHWHQHSHGDGTEPNEEMSLHDRRKAIARRIESLERYGQHA